MEELFNIEKMESSIKKAKKRTTRKMILISCMTALLFLGLAIVGYFANFYFVEEAARKVESAFQDFDVISGPNEFVGVTEHYPGLLTGENRYKKYKWVAGKLVLSGEGAYNYGIFSNQKVATGKNTTGIFGGAFSQEDVGGVHYDEQGQRLMTFFYPQLSYDRVTDDLSQLAEMPEDLLVEIALSFDQGYRWAQVEQLLPATIQPAWFWVNDVAADADLYSYDYYDAKNFTKQPLVRNEQNVYGFAMIDADGQAIENPVEMFMYALSNGSKIETRWQTEFKRIMNTLGKLEEESLVLNGVVVTGSVEELRALIGAPYVKASSFGVIVDKY